MRCDIEEYRQLIVIQYLTSHLHFPSTIVFRRYISLRSLCDIAAQRFVSIATVGRRHKR